MFLRNVDIDIILRGIIFQKTVVSHFKCAYVFMAHIIISRTFVSGICLLVYVNQCRQ